MNQVCPAYCVTCCEDIDLKRRISTWHIFLVVICNAVAVDAAAVLYLLFIYFYFLIFPILFCYIYIYIYRAFSLLAIWCLGPRVQILHAAEEHNLSPFDLNIACLCQSIEINNNKYIYRQSQVRKSTDSGVKWAECSLIIGTGCGVQVFSLILDSSVGLSASIQSAGNLVSGTPVQILHSAEEHNLSPFDLNIACLCQSIEINNNKYIHLTMCTILHCTEKFKELPRVLCAH